MDDFFIHNLFLNANKIRCNKCKKLCSEYIGEKRTYCIKCVEKRR